MILINLTCFLINNILFDLKKKSKKKKKTESRNILTEKNAFWKKSNGIWEK